MRQIIGTMCIHINLCIHVYIYVCIGTYTHPYIYMYTYIYIYEYVYTHIHMYMYKIYIYIYREREIHTCIIRYPVVVPIYRMDHKPIEIKGRVVLAGGAFWDLRFHELRLGDRGSPSVPSWLPGTGRRSTKLPRLSAKLWSLRQSTGPK